jgi:hypothetical protein
LNFSTVGSNDGLQREINFWEKKILKNIFLLFEFLIARKTLGPILQNFFNYVNSIRFPILTPVYQVSFYRHHNKVDFVGTTTFNKVYLTRTKLNEDYFFQGKTFFCQTPDHQGCQMVCFQTKNPNLGKSWRVLQLKTLLYFMDTWSILRFYVIFNGHLV